MNHIKRMLYPLTIMGVNKVTEMNDLKSCCRLVWLMASECSSVKGAVE